jgi:hypothetical protein
VAGTRSSSNDDRRLLIRPVLNQQVFVRDDAGLDRTVTRLDQLSVNRDGPALLPNHVKRYQLPIF